MARPQCDIPLVFIHSFNCKLCHTNIFIHFVHGMCSNEIFWCIHPYNDPNNIFKGIHGCLIMHIKEKFCTRFLCECKMCSSFHRDFNFVMEFIIYKKFLLIIICLCIGIIYIIKYWCMHVPLVPTSSKPNYFTFLSPKCYCCFLFGQFSQHCGFFSENEKTEKKVIGWIQMKGSIVSSVQTKLLLLTHLTH
jgi:hypothetical protein